MCANGVLKNCRPYLKSLGLLFASKDCSTLSSNICLFRQELAFIGGKAYRIKQWRVLCTMKIKRKRYSFVYCRNDWGWWSQERDLATVGSLDDYVIFNNNLAGVDWVRLKQTSEIRLSGEKGGKIRT